MAVMPSRGTPTWSADQMFRAEGGPLSRARVAIDRASQRYRHSVSGPPTETRWQRPRRRVCSTAVWPAVSAAGDGTVTRSHVAHCRNRQSGEGRPTRPIYPPP